MQETDPPNHEAAEKEWLDVEGKVVYAHRIVERPVCLVEAIQLTVCHVLAVHEKETQVYEEYADLSHKQHTYYQSSCLLWKCLAVFLEEDNEITSHDA